MSQVHWLKGFMGSGPGGLGILSTPPLGRKEARCLVVSCWRAAGSDLSSRARFDPRAAPAGGHFRRKSKGGKGLFFSERFCGLFIVSRCGARSSVFSGPSFGVWRPFRPPWPSPSRGPRDLGWRGPSGPNPLCRKDFAGPARRSGRGSEPSPGRAPPRRLGSGARRKKRGSSGICVPATRPEVRVPLPCSPFGGRTQFSAANGRVWQQRRGTRTSLSQSQVRQCRMNQQRDPAAGRGPVQGGGTPSGPVGGSDEQLGDRIGNHFGILGRTGSRTRTRKGPVTGISRGRALLDTWLKTGSS